jgi:hypothetical protein
VAARRGGARAPVRGAVRPTLAADPLRAARLTLALDRAAAPGPLASTLAWGVRLAGARTDLGCGGAAGGGGLCAGFARGAATARLVRPVGERRLVLETVAAAAAGRVPVQELAFLGGPVTRRDTSSTPSPAAPAWASARSGSSRCRSRRYR